MKELIIYVFLSWRVQDCMLRHGEVLGLQDSLDRAQLPVLGQMWDDFFYVLIPG